MKEGFNLNTMVISGDDSPISPRLRGQSIKQAKSQAVGRREARALVRILSTPVDKRSLENIEEMKECLSKVKFLQDYRQSQYFGDVLKNLELESYNQDNILFRQYDYADKFYIILSGTIGLYIQAPNNVENFLKYGSDTKNQNNDSNNKQGNQNNTEKTAKKNEEGQSDQQNTVAQTKTTKIVAAVGENNKEGEQNVFGVGVREIARLESGESFGELGLLFNERRTATAICLEGTSLLVLKKAVFEKYLAKNAGGKVSSMVEFYSGLWQLRSLSSKEILQLATKTTLTECRQPTVVIREDEKPKGVFFVRKGSVKILTSLKFKLSNDGRNETDIVNDPSLFNSMDMSEPSVEELRAKKYRTVEVQVDEIGDGGVFADYEAFSGIDVPFTALTDTFCDILAVSMNDLKMILPKDVFQSFIENAKKYPSAEKIKRQYAENLLWSAFKNDLVHSFNNDLVNQIRCQYLMKHRQPFLPKLSLEKYMVNAGQEERIENSREDEGLDFDDKNERKDHGASKMLDKKQRNKERNNSSFASPQLYYKNEESLIPSIKTENKRYSVHNLSATNPISQRNLTNNKSSNQFVNNSSTNNLQLHSSSAANIYGLNNPKGNKNNNVSPEKTNNVGKNSNEITYLAPSSNGQINSQQQPKIFHQNGHINSSGSSPFFTDQNKKKYQVSSQSPFSNHASARYTNNQTNKQSCYPLPMNLLPNYLNPTEQTDERHISELNQAQEKQFLKEQALYQLLSVQNGIKSNHHETRSSLLKKHDMNSKPIVKEGLEEISHSKLNENINTNKDKNNNQVGISSFTKRLSNVKVILQDEQRKSFISSKLIMPRVNKQSRASVLASEIY